MVVMGDEINAKEQKQAERKRSNITYLWAQTQAASFPNNGGANLWWWMQ
jgi:hypothetical protein